MNKISVLALFPFWRYAVGPSSQHSPAIPFYTLASARGLFVEMKRDLPFCGGRLYQRTWRGLIVLDEYKP